jgi:hypothetical protein
MTKKGGSSSKKWLLLAAAAGAAWYFWPSSAPAAPAPATVSAGAQTYLTQIMAAQNQFQAGTQTQQQYTASAQALLTKAQTDSNVTAADMTTLHAVAGV